MNNQCVICGGECREEEQVCKACRDAEERESSNPRIPPMTNFEKNGGCMSITLGLIVIIMFVGGVVIAKGIFDLIFGFFK